MSEENDIWTPERSALALAEAERWMGCPHKDRMARMGIGVDCIHYVCEVLFAAEVVDRRDMPTYDTALGMAGSGTPMKDAIMEHLFVEELPTFEATFGDIVLMKTVESSSHCGWYGDGLLYHSLARRCVTRSPWNHWRRKATCVLRLTQVGWRKEP